MPIMQMEAEQLAHGLHLKIFADGKTTHKLSLVNIRPPIQCCRLRARIPLSAIMHCEAVTEGAMAWCKKHGFSIADTLTSTPADTPNVMIAIDPAAGLSVKSWQHERPTPKYLFLFVDHPGQLVSRLPKRDATHFGKLEN